MRTLTIIFVFIIIVIITIIFYFAYDTGLNDSNEKRSQMTIKKLKKISSSGDLSKIDDFDYFAEPIIFKKCKTGYIIYSKGVNRIDDETKGDDLVLNVDCK